MKMNTYNYIDLAIHNNKTAIIMAPIMEKWDKGNFCKPLTNILINSGYKVSIYDSSCCANMYDSIDEVALFWLKILKNKHSSIDLLIGQAYGGTVAFNLINIDPQICCNAITISSPAKSDNLLRYRLNEIIDLLSSDRYAEALHFLGWRVHSEYSPQMPPKPQTLSLPNIKDRLIPGFKHLCNSNIKHITKEFKGKIISLYGDSSRLVHEKNIMKPTKNHSIYIIEKSGMRPFLDSNEKCMGIINQFIIELQQVNK